jgi:hypothetical protein
MKDAKQNSRLTAAQTEKKNSVNLTALSVPQPLGEMGHLKTNHKKEGKNESI